MIGKTLGHYEVLAPLGKGGMGEVYRARDTRLDREVALKFLPPEMLDDAERRARFEREARTLASLSHPNIAAIHGLEEADGQRFLAIELVEGEDLSEALRRGPLPIDEALRIAAAVAEGLEAAHEQGIVHRDLKPANVRLNAETEPKILDFGLARAVVAENADEDSIWSSPTITAQFTQPGVILGTAAYMSPEQARGKPVDRRADIWSFGCLLFEMLSGKAPFAGDSITDVLAEIVKSEPDWSLLPDGTPQRVKVLLWRCLQKDPRRRLRDIGEARFELGESPSDPSGSFTMLGGTQLPASRPWAAFVVIALVALATGIGIGRALLGPDTTVSSPPQTAVFPLLNDPNAPYVRLYGISFAITPDGRSIFYATTPEGSSTAASDLFALAMRKLDDPVAQRVHGVESGVSLTFAPDGRNFAYMQTSSAQWKRVSLDGGATQLLGTAMLSRLESSYWAKDGHIYFGSIAGIDRIPEAGGEREQLFATAADGSESISRILAEASGRWLLVGILRPEDRSAVAAFDLQTREMRDLAAGRAPIAITPSGLLLFQRGSNVLAQRIDREKMELIGAEQLVLDQVSDDYAVSENGNLVYTVGSGGMNRQGSFVWIDRDGTVTPAFGGESFVEPRYPRVSPDGRQVVYTDGPGGQGQLWVRDLEGRRPAVNLTFENHNVLATWSGDGKKIIFKRVDSGGGERLYELAANGSDLEPRQLTAAGTAPDGMGWLEDGRLLVLQSAARNNSDLLTLDTATAEIDTLLASDFREGFASVDPSGRWIAFEWNRSGSNEIWVRRYADGETRRVSSRGGQDPVWSRDGSELYFQQESSLMVVPVSWNGNDIQLATPTELFRDCFTVAINFTPRTYDVTPDGRFLMLQVGGFESQASQTIVRLNWFAEVDRRFAERSR